MFLQAGHQVTPTLASLIHPNSKSSLALGALVEEIHNNKELTCYQLINHPHAVKIIDGIIQMIGSPESSVSGNAAYVIGSLCDLAVIRRRVIDLITQESCDDKDLLINLTKLLHSKDQESRMNASGAIATLAENLEGRCWLLRNPALDDTIARASFLLTTDEMWAASNCSLVIGRLAIDEEGCARILNRRDSKKIIIRLIKALGCDEEGRGMNSGFAIGRLCDMPSGRKQVLMLKQRDQMLCRLVEMLQYHDFGCKKNASFALSSIATSDEGHAIVIQHPQLPVILNCLIEIMNDTEEEAIWFATMLVRTLVSKRQGCLMLRDMPELKGCLQCLIEKEDITDDVRDEIALTLEIMKRLEQPNPVTVRVESASTAVAIWEAVNPKSGLEVTYHLFEGKKEIYTGAETTITINDLKPMTKYSYRMRVSTEGDISPFSNPVYIETPETVPGAPQGFQVIVRSTTMLRVGWDPPTEANGILKGYQVVRLNQLGVPDVQINTNSRSHIFTHLAAGTEYHFQVCAITSAGKGERATLVASTMDLREHAPPAPALTVLGSNEIFVNWQPPAGPVGRLNRYELRMNGKSVYSGIERSFAARGLHPKTEYTFTVTAWTSEGRCTSKPASKRTASDSTRCKRPQIRSKSIVETCGKDMVHSDLLERTIATAPLKRGKTGRKSYPKTKIPALCRAHDQGEGETESIIKLELSKRSFAAYASGHTLDETLSVRNSTAHASSIFPRADDKQSSGVLSVTPLKDVHCKGWQSPFKRDIVSAQMQRPSPCQNLRSTVSSMSIGSSSLAFSQALDDLRDSRLLSTNGFHTALSRTSWRPSVRPVIFYDRKPKLS